MTPAELRQQLADALAASDNLRAFLHVIRAGEGTDDPKGWRRHYGGALFDRMDDHPRQAVKAGRWTSTAAGAYQFLERTWDECRAALELPDFAPLAQDLAAVYLIQRRGALADVLAGRLDAAITKCNREWASLPGSPYGQPTRSREQAHATYAQAGGTLADVPAASPAPPPAATPQEPTAMPIPAILAALLRRRATTSTIAGAMRILAADIQSDDGIATAAILEAAERLDELATLLRQAAGPMSHERWSSGFRAKVARAVL